MRKIREEDLSYKVTSTDYMVYYKDQCVFRAGTCGKPVRENHDLFVQQAEAEKKRILDGYMGMLTEQAIENIQKCEDWAKYIAYIHEWAEDHSDPLFLGCCPASYDEWYDNEYEEEDEA